MPISKKGRRRSSPLLPPLINKGRCFACGIIFGGTQREAAMVGDKRLCGYCSKIIRLRGKIEMTIPGQHATYLLSDGYMGTENGS